jgi:hypothetical protein
VAAEDVVDITKEKICNIVPDLCKTVVTAAGSLWIYKPLNHIDIYFLRGTESHRLTHRGHQPTGTHHDEIKQSMMSHMQFHRRLYHCGDWMKFINHK